MIRIAIAEDNRRIADILKSKIELVPDFKVSIIAENGKDLFDQLRLNHNIEVVFMDINMPVLNGIDATKLVADRYPNIKIIISSIYDDEENIFDAIVSGAVGYILKDAKTEDIHRAIYEVLEGGVPMSPEIARKALKLIKSGTPSHVKEIDYGLTSREIEILTHLSKGLQYDEIADNLYISKNTVRKHIENIYHKLQVTNKVEAIQKIKF